MISGSALLCLVFLEFNARKRRTCAGATSARSEL